MSTDPDTPFLPPRDFADFVVHYDGTAFRVHRFVLHNHSAYFRAYFQTLSAISSTAPASDGPQPDNSSPASDSPQPCDHPSIAHCIHLPLQTTLVEQTPVTAADFRLFLCHLYFSAHYCYPPCLPKTDIDLDADCPLPSLAFAAVPSWLDWSPASSYLRFTDAEPKQAVCHESLLALAHYLDCARLLRQCDAVLLTKKEWGDRQTTYSRATVYSSPVPTYSAWQVDECLRSVQLADRYGLQQCRRACVDLIGAAAHRTTLANEQYKREKHRWDRALLLDILEAKLHRLASSAPQ